MIDIGGAIPNILTRLKKTAIGHGLDLRTFKRDRSIAIRHIEQDVFEIKEDGFQIQTFTIHRKELKKTLKTLFKREFPRSNKIRIYPISN